MNSEKQKRKPNILARLLPYAGRKRWLLYLGMVLSALSGIAVLLPMVFIHRIVRGIILSGVIDTASITSDALWAALCAGLGLLLYFSALMASHMVAFEVEQNIVALSMRRLMEKPMGFFAQRESGQLRKTIVDGAAETHSLLAHQLADMAMTMVTPVVLLVFFFAFDWRLGLISAVPVAIGMLLITTMISKESQAMRTEYYDGMSKLAAEVVEYVRGIPVVKVFAQSVESFSRLHARIQQMHALVIRWTMMFRRNMSIFEAVAGSTAFFLVPVAILLFTTGGDMREVLGNSIIYMLIGPAFGMFIMRSASISSFSYLAALSLDRIDGALAYEDMSYGEQTEVGDGLEFRNVSFSYQADRVLEGISFEVRQGETVALVGSSGGGKTTIARLAARFYDAEEGEVLFGGVNIRDFDRAALMDRVAFVFQNAKLFKKSLRENLLMAKPNATEAELLRALELSGAKEIVDRLEHGLDTVYGTKGLHFSGGEVQRLAIARTLLKDASLVILDEATAFADPENEHAIMAAMREVARGKTTLMIAHRLSSVVHADRILVVDGGRIVESGTHQELLAKEGEYSRLWDEYQRAANWKIGGRDE